jgi:Lrp/AsnC family transcriptional regulator, leucine-responsive regulatory protein
MLLILYLQKRKKKEMYKDKVDEKIIGYLKEDSRESFVDIGKKLKLSESAVRRRVKNLVDSGTIKKFTLELGDENSTSAIVLVSVDSATETSKVSLKLAKLEGVKTVYEITGQYDITTIMSATNIAEINSTIDALRKIPGVVDTNTVIILRKII